MTYVDGFVVPVPEDKLAEYKKMAKTAAKVWVEHGALQYVECVADDVQEGKSTDFYRAVKRREGETVVFAYIVYKSKKNRDAVLKKAVADPRIPQDAKGLPFDARRMFWGGFKTIVGM